MKLILFLLAFLAMAARADATVWYVATTGADGFPCASAQNPATPKLTPAAALACVAAAGSVAGAGHTVQIAAGTYSGSAGSLVDVIPSGTSASMFTIKCETDGACIFAPNASAYAFGFNTSTKHVVVRGFKITSGVGMFSSAPEASCNAGTFDNIQFIKIEIDGTAMGSTAMGFQGCGHNLIFDNVKIHHLNGGGGFSHAIYAVRYTKNWRIRNSQFYDNGSYGLHIHPGTEDTGYPTGFAIHNNFFARNGTPFVNGGAMIVIGAEHIIFRNVDTGSRWEDGSAFQFALFGSTLAYNNTVYNSAGNGIRDRYGVTSLTCKNNIVIGSAGTALFDCNSASSNNITTGTAASHFVNAAAEDFSLISTSTAKNAGTTAVGTWTPSGAPVNIVVPFNGTLPDIGAHEELGAVNCTIATATPTVLNCTGQNNVFPPLLPATGITGWTVTRAGSNNAVVSNARTGSNTFDITVTSAFTAGQACVPTYAQTGNFTDSALIGGTANQELFAGNATCTNNVSGGAGATITQSHGAMFAWDGTESSGAQIGSTNPTSLRAMVFAKYLARFGLKTTVADTPATNYALNYSKNGGAYAVVPTFTGSEDVGICDGPAVSASNTIQRLTSGSFVAGRVVEVGAGVPTITMTSGQSTELLYPICYGPGLVSGTDNLKFRIYKDTGAALDAYDTNATLNIDVVAPGLSGL